MRAKRILSFLLSLTICLSVFSGLSISASASSKPNVILDSYYDDSSKILTVDVILDNIYGHETALAFIDYPEEQLEYLSCKTYNKKNDAMLCAGKNKDGNLSVSAVHMTYFSKNTMKVATFIFKRINTEQPGITFTVMNDSLVDGSIRLTDSFYIQFDELSPAEINKDVFINTSYNEISKELTVDVFVTGAKEYAQIFLDYRVFNNGGYQFPLTFISGTAMQKKHFTIVAGETNDSEKLLSSGMLTTNEISETTWHISRFVLKNDRNTDRVTFTIADGSEIDKKEISGTFSVDLSSVALPKPDFVFESSFDSESRILTLDVSAINIKNNITLNGFITFPKEKAEFISSEDFRSEYITVSGLCTDGKTISVAAMASREFKENDLDIARFYFKIANGVDEIQFTLSPESILNNKIPFEQKTYTAQTKNKNTNTVTCGIDYSYNETAKELYITVSAQNTINCRYAAFRLNFNPAEIEYIESNFIEYPQYTASSGIISNKNQIFASVAAPETFTNNEIAIASFTMKVKPGIKTVTLTVDKESYCDSAFPIPTDSFIITIPDSSEAECTHKNLNTVSAIQPTCKNDGHTEEITCADCGKIIKKGETIPALGHTEETVKGKPANCTTAGLTDGIKCSVCGEILKKQTEIPAPGHTEEVIKGKPADCTTAGLSDGIKCSVCGEILRKQTEIPALGHSEEVIKGKPADCTTAGLTDGIKCSVCGEILKKQTEIPAPGHTYENGRCSVCETADPNYKLETLENHDKDITVDNKKNIITSIPDEITALTAAQFKSQFAVEIDLDIADDALISNGTKFTFNDIEYTIIIKGDTAADGKITAADAREILRIAAKLENPDEVTFSAADINSDSKVSANEARNVLRFVAKLSASIEG